MEAQSRELLIQGASENDSSLRWESDLGDLMRKGRENKRGSE